MNDVRFLSTAELEAGLPQIRAAPRDQGRLELIVRRPHEEAREIIAEGTLDQNVGLVGDTWRERTAASDPADPGERDTQLTIMSSRAAELVAQSKSRWPLAGDQLYVDLDLSAANLPAGTRLAIGSAIVEVTAVPHTGCKKFVARFGLEAMKFVNSDVGKSLRLRGLNAKIVQPGTIKVGDVVTKA